MCGNFPLQLRWQRHLKVVSWEGFGWGLWVKGSGQSIVGRQPRKIPQRAKPPDIGTKLPFTVSMSDALFSISPIASSS